MDKDNGELDEFEINQEENSEDQEVIGVNSVPIEIVEDDTITFQSFKRENTDNISLEGVSSNVKGRYYKQTYRTAWEQMPDFAGWLQGVDNEPTRAFCIYCQKTLHAHRLSLLKHTCTIRHQKAAQLHQMRTKKTVKHKETSSIIINNSNMENEVEEGEMIEFSESVLSNENEDDDDDVHVLHEIDADQLDDDMDEIDTADLDTSDKKNDISSPISTEVTDSVRGIPMSGLPVSLYKLIDGRWTYINEGFTNHSGKFSKFLDGLEFTPGRYKLHYDVDKYYEARKLDSIYPFIEIVFDFRGANSKYHFPLVVSPNGYTTYRGM